LININIAISPKVVCNKVSKPHIFYVVKICDNFRKKCKKTYFGENRQYCLCGCRLFLQYCLCVCRLHSKKVCVRKRSQGFCVVRTQTFDLDNLKNYLCGFVHFVLKIQKFHTNLCWLTHFSNYQTQICVLTTQNPCDRFQTQSLCCRNTNFLRVFFTAAISHVPKENSTPHE
jgi:hypothetical protein